MCKHPTCSAGTGEVGEVSSFKFQVSGFEFRVSGFEVSTFKLPVSSLKLRGLKFELEVWV
jgi:hypothetical protein